MSNVTVRGTDVAYIFQLTEYKHQSGHNPILRLETHIKRKILPSEVLDTVFDSAYKCLRIIISYKISRAHSIKVLDNLKTCLIKLGRDAANFETWPTMDIRMKNYKDWAVESF